MSELKKGKVEANGLTFHYLEAGEGPLALCLHGFPDSPHTFRHLLPELANAGFRAVAIYMRGYAPSSLSDQGDYTTKALLTDVNALHSALGADQNAVLLAHDWGAVAAYGALIAEPKNWRRAFIGNVPHLAVFGKIMTSYEQYKKSFYFWLFQMKMAQAVVEANDLEFIDNLWRDWSPNFDPSEELKLVKPSLRDPQNLKAAMGYYHYFLNSEKFGFSDHMEEIAGLIGAPLVQPILYIHGKADGCIGLSEENAKELLEYFGAGSKVINPDEVGHFFLVEKPEIFNPMILEFLTSK